MIVNKTKLGVPFFDSTFGGIFSDRSVLCCGRRGSGKSVLAMHFLSQAITDDHKALLLTNAHPHDFVIVADSLGLPLADAVASGQLTILEYATLIPESNASQNIMLPPDAFDELSETIEREAINRLAFDTVLPWVTIQPVARIPKHVYSFCHAIDRLGTTTLFTIPKPVSNAAFALRNAIEDFCPIAIELHHHTDDAPHTLSVTKYLGETANLSVRYPFAIIPNQGFAFGASEAAAAAAPAYVRPPVPPASVVHPGRVQADAPFVPPVRPEIPPPTPAPAPAPGRAANAADPALPLPSLDGHSIIWPASPARPSSVPPPPEPDDKAEFSNVIKLPGVQ